MHHLASRTPRALLAALAILALSCGGVGGGGSGSDAGVGGRDGGAPDGSVSPPPKLLLAHAGNDRMVRPGVLVQLDGSASLALGYARLTQAWTQLSGPPVTLSDPSTRSPRFRAPATSADLDFRLEVFAEDEVRSDLVRILVRESVRDTPPFASAGADLALAPGETTTLSSAGSTDADQDPLEVRWLSTLGDLLSREASLEVDPGDALLTHRRLVVTDGLLESKDDVLLWADPALVGQHPPEVSWTTNHVTDPGVAVVLWGTAEDPEGDPVRLRWRQLDGPLVTLETDKLRARFVAPRQVTLLLFKVHASDGLLSSAPLPVIVEVTAGEGNHAPSADAGADLVVGPGATVTLDGTGSSDSDGTPIVAWEWLQIGGPLIVLEQTDQPVLSFEAPADPTTLVFTLTVFDDQVASEADMVSVRVE
ncbi:MAG: hypothetical protein P1V51_05745 [Deltaproteobacteria bacterium]|nr:hypothetical protein [Deltaproteobacteria bacterium]